MGRHSRRYLALSEPCVAYRTRLESMVRGPVELNRTVDEEGHTRRARIL